MQRTRENYEELALRLLALADQTTGSDSASQSFATQALAYATLALAAETEEVD